MAPVSDIQTTEEVRSAFAVVRAGAGPARMVQTWLGLLGDSEAALRALGPLYLDRATALAKAERLCALLRLYRERFADESVIIARAPGRLNIMGRHIDHQGGHVNMIALDRDTWVIAGKSAGPEVTLVNLDGALFPERRFAADALIPEYRGQGWREYVDEPQMLALTAAAGGDWSQYVKAALARFLARFPGLECTGLNLAVGGDIPSAAGLSSSSALVVSAMEALCSLHGVSLPEQEFAELCGEAEWYVGTRGGSGDHAAMKFARRGKVVQIRFFPMEVTDCVDFPPGHVILVCKSGIEARKSAGVKDIFNHRVACYHLGRELFKRAHADIAEGTSYLRDLMPDKLGIRPRALLHRLAALPELATRDELRQLLPAEVLEPLFASHNEDPGPYPVRQVMLYGLAECERSRRTPSLLRNERFDAFGDWMNISHNGDRVEPRPLVTGPEAELIQLAGSYACSLPEIDSMADTVLKVGGVLGAQISGAGLGGCLMVLAREDAVASVTNALNRDYYGPAGIEPDVFPCSPSAGSGVLD